MTATLSTKPLLVAINGCTLLRELAISTLSDMGVPGILVISTKPLALGLVLHNEVSDLFTNILMIMCRRESGNCRICYSADSVDDVETSLDTNKASVVVAVRGFLGFSHPIIPMAILIGLHLLWIWSNWTQD